MVRVYSPNSEMELINLRAILIGADVPFYVHNDHFGSMEIGPRIDLLNGKTIWVAEQDATRARELIDDYVSVTTAIPTRLSFWHVVRMIAEVMFFGWLFPYRANRQDEGSAAV